MPLGIWECVPFFRVYLPHDHDGPFKCCLQYFKKTFYMFDYVAKTVPVYVIQIKKIIIIK
jgi:hypothetical protein